MTARRIALINEKGGTCKTTLAVNLGAWLALHRYRVLLCDLDTQGHAGKALGLDVRGLAPTIHDLLVDRSTSLTRVLRPSSIPGLDLLPSNKSLAEFPTVVGAAPDRARRLAQRLVGLQGYDFILFDSPPSMSLTTLNIMVATEEIVIPVALTYFALDGCAEICQTVERVREEQGRPNLRISLVVPTLYRKTTLADEIVAKLKERFPDELSRVVLGYDVKLDEAQSHGKTIWEYAPSSRAAAMLEAIALDLLERAPARPINPEPRPEGPRVEPRVEGRP
jgi:chromosome partitioning protein